ncbi:MAG: hypothetical protein ACOC2F_00375, partial [Bacteroidota bacterium]
PGSSKTRIETYKEITRPHAYKLGYDKCNDIKEAIYSNKRKGVTSLMAKWINSENPTLQIAAMRMIGDEDERQKLNQQYIEMKTSINKIEYEVIKNESEN